MSSPQVLVPYEVMNLIALMNVVLLSLRKGGPAAYILNGVLILAAGWALLLYSFGAEFGQEDYEYARYGWIAIAAAVVNVITLRRLSMRHP